MKASRNCYSEATKKCLIELNASILNNEKPDQKIDLKQCSGVPIFFFIEMQSSLNEYQLPKIDKEYALMDVGQNMSKYIHLKNDAI